MAKKITNRNTKAEILEAFEQLQQEKSSLESQLKKVEKEKKAVINQPLTAVKENLTPEPTPMKDSQTAQSKITQTIQNLELLQLGFGSAVSNLSEQLITEASSLESLQELVNEETQQLQELHELEKINDTTLDTLVESYQESAKTSEEELAERKETLALQIQELEKAWKKEQETHQRDIKERNETLSKTRQRDQEEYQYNLELERTLAQEDFEQEKNGLYKELAEIREQQEKQWTARENTIAEREKQYYEAKSKVEAFPEELEKNIKNGKENGRNIGQYQARVKADLRTKEVEGQKRYYELQIESLNQTIQNQELRIQSLSKQLDAGLKQVQDLAVKAIEGASNANSFQTMKELLQDQVKNQQKAK